MPVTFGPNGTIMFTADDNITGTDTAETADWQTVTIADYYPPDSTSAVTIHSYESEIDELKKEIDQLKSDNQKLLAMFDKLTAKEVAELMKEGD